MASTSPISRPAFLETVPSLWPDSTIVCIGSGPSLLATDIETAFNAGARLLVINDAVRLTGNKADLLFAADAKWWEWHKDVPDSELPVHLWTVDPNARDFRPSVHVVNYNGHAGFERSRCSIRTGGHSGFMGVHMAAHLGAKKIILLAYDMQPGPNGEQRFCGDHPDGTHINYDLKVGVYETLREPFQRRGITFLNASRTTAITSVPRCSLTDALAA